MSLVLDSSVTLAWFFEDERSEGGDALLRQVVKSGAVVPSLWRLEVGNALQSCVRRKRISPAFCDSTLSDLRALPITVDMEADAHAWSLANRHGLSLYDAAYLELAQRLRLPLASVDKSLRVSARRERIALRPS